MLSSSRALRRWAAALLAVALSVVLAACGGESEGAAAPTAEKIPADGVYPRVVGHLYGFTEIAKEPERIVTLGLSDQDAVLALGVKPVGAVDWFKEEPYGKWPWTKKLWGDQPPKIVGERDEYQMEKIAELKPDLILAQYSGMKKEQYETLSEIAPVIAQPKDYEPYLAPWQVMTKQIGKAMGKTEQVDKLIGEIDTKFAEVGEAHPEWSDLTLAVADSFEAGKYSAFTEDDPKAAFFAELGFTLSAEVEKLAQEGSNVAELAAEKLDVLDVDRLVWVTSGPEHEKRIQAEPLYRKLAVAKEKRDLFVPYEDPDIGAAFSFNTVLSIPYAIDEMGPLLAAEDNAAKAGDR
ncbi:MAG: iron-siderophore ABC transporter substrate-binding protein [Thermocrispum sp.]